MGAIAFWGLLVGLINGQKKARHQTHRLIFIQKRKCKIEYEMDTTNNMSGIYRRRQLDNKNLVAFT